MYASAEGWDTHFRRDLKDAIITYTIHIPFNNLVIILQNITISNRYLIQHELYLSETVLSCTFMHFSPKLSKAAIIKRSKL